MAENNIVIRLADWENDRETLTAIRSRVFIEEQNIPADMEWDEFDSSATHFLVFEKDQAIACARLNSDGKIGRMAVLDGHRNEGTGKTLLQFVLREAVTQNLGVVYLHAQISALTFYEKQGFTIKGDVFYEANIPHREMLKKCAK